MLPKTVSDDETLYRNVPEKPSFIKHSNGKISGVSSAAFKDSKGASVDRDGKRDEGVIVDNFKSRFENGLIVKVQTATCRKKDAEVVEASLSTNPYHALIIRCIKDTNNKANADKIELTQGTAKFISKNAVIVYPTED